MDRDELSRLILVILALASGLARPVQAQFGLLLNPAYAPQAKSEEELDEYLQIITEPDPLTIVRKVDLFASTYPKSELLGVAYQYQMVAYQRLNNLDGTLRAGEKALQLEPHNVNTLLTLASAIANGSAGGSTHPDPLRRAKEYANEALQELERMRIPREISLDRWKIMRGEMEAQTHESLGYIDSEQGNIPGALKEFEVAAAGNPKPEGSQFYRLGIAYVLSGQKDRAKDALRRAVTLGPDAVRRLAQAELIKLSERQLQE